MWVNTEINSYLISDWRNWWSYNSSHVTTIPAVPHFYYMLFITQIYFKVITSKNNEELKYSTTNKAID